MKIELCRMLGVISVMSATVCAYADWRYSGNTLTQIGGDQVINAVSVVDSNHLKIGYNKNNTTLVGQLDLSAPIVDAGNNAYIITHLDGSAFYNLSNITEVILPDTIESIGTSAFRNCSGIVKLSPMTFSNIAFPGNAVRTFELMSNLHGDMVINDFDNEVIGERMFYNLNSISSLEVHTTDSCTSIDKEAFRNFGSYDEPTRLLLIDVPELDTTSTPLNNFQFQNCKVAKIAILAKKAVEFEVGAFNGINGLSAVVKTFVFAGPACTQSSLDAIIDGFKCTLSEASIHVSTKQFGWTVLADTNCDLTDAPEGAFGKFYHSDSGNNSKWVWAVNEPSIYDPEDGEEPAVLFIEGSLGDSIGEVTGFTYGKQQDMTAGTSLVLTAPEWDDGNGTRYVAKASTVYLWDKNADNWDESSAVRVTGSTREMVMVKGKQKIVWEWAVFGAKLNLTIQGSGTVVCTPESEDGFYDAGTQVELTAVDGEGSFTRYIADGCVNPKVRSITVTLNGTFDVVAVFDQPWVVDETDANNVVMSDGVWTFPVWVEASGAVTVSKKEGLQTHPVLDFSKQVLTTKEAVAPRQIVAIDNAAFGNNYVSPLEVIMPPTLVNPYSSIFGGNEGHANTSITNLVVDCPLLQTINTSNFRGLSSLKNRGEEWKLPLVDTLEANAFKDATIYGSLVFSNLVKVANNVFEGLKKIEYIEIAGDNLKFENSAQFQSCEAEKIVIRSRVEDTVPTTFLRNALTKHVVFDCPNLEKWGFTSGHTISQVERIEFLTDKSLWLDTSAAINHAFDANALKEVIFSGAIPEENFLTAMLAKPQDYQVTIYAPLKRADWLHSPLVSSLSEEERAMENRPPKAKRVLKAGGKTAWLINTSFGFGVLVK